MNKKLKNCSVVVKDVFNELKAENNRLLSDLCFEKRLNTVLQNMRNFSLKLINDCKCQQNCELLAKFNEFNDNFVELIESQGI